MTGPQLLFPLNPVNRGSAGHASTLAVVFLGNGNLRPGLVCVKIREER